MSEIKDQREIAKSIRNRGGYAKKWASGYIVGVPDLICSLPGVGAFFMEVKTIHISRPDFKRSLAVTPKQRHELAGLVNSGAKACIGLVIKSEKGHKVHPRLPQLHILQPSIGAVYTGDMPPEYEDGRIAIQISLEGGVQRKPREGYRDIAGHLHDMYWTKGMGDE